MFELLLTNARSSVDRSAEETSAHDVKSSYKREIDGKVKDVVMIQRRTPRETNLSTDWLKNKSQTQSEGL